ncbi:MAG: acyl-CoA dehydratase activase [Syntrophales bacterium]|jgi:predicted CoA-substrate-specific enzyme activase|nr:acyl-CoA dehydratase activase [Syntrophales bacterium]
MAEIYKAGIDAGSTTVKLVVCAQNGSILFSRYRRHHSLTLGTIAEMLIEARQELGNIVLDVVLTGSAGMGVAESFQLPFIQEVVASTKIVQRRWPDVRTLIEIGGEDSKIAFFDNRFQPDIRMNGNCAGGTGAFIEQMAVLLNEPLNKLDELAQKSGALYPIASRCGVFAKTDVQALLSNRVSREDIAASVFHAMAIQVISSLSRGHDIESKVLFAGGPLTFFPSLRAAFIRLLQLDPEKDIAAGEHPELMAAVGAALCHAGEGLVIEIEKCLQLIQNGTMKGCKEDQKRLPPLFSDQREVEIWEEEHHQKRVCRVDVSELKGVACFLGIDSGSTTTKLVLIDDKRRVALTWYQLNGGDAIGAARRGLLFFRDACREAGVAPFVARTAVTGYGEDLIRAAFAIDDGVVETVAHYRAARHFLPEVSFILDIGGQDMKAIYVRDGGIADIQINEACSSGCGSFIETLANSLKISVSDFAGVACRAEAPFDLGTRCTVFMNSRVKQALREGATVGDISAGLASSVIGNTLYKVLKLHDPSALGDKIVVQGGTFRNPAVLRAFELEIGRQVIRPDISEAMGAYGAALTALQDRLAEPTRASTFPGLDAETQENIIGKKELRCSGCENNCKVARITFSGGRNYFTGNRCERHFSNKGAGGRQGENLFIDRLKLIFDQPLLPEQKPLLTFGIPRALNMFENFPFWANFLTACGFKVVLSAPSDTKLFERGIRTVMSDNICFPGKLANGHILDLIEKKVERIFYPIVVFEAKEDADTLNSFNCPVVTGYPDVIRSAIDPEGRYGLPLDCPVVSFRSRELLEKQLYSFFKGYGIARKTISAAVTKGREAQQRVREEMSRRAVALIEKARAEKRFAVVVAGRPYHADPLVNHGLPEMLAGMGVDVIPESAVPVTKDGHILKDISVLSQWEYTNRILAVSRFVAANPHLELLQITSFGCGLDAISTDEARDIITEKGKVYTLIKMDEISNLGAVRIRLRSMLDIAKERSQSSTPHALPPLSAERVEGKEAERTIIVPWFSPFYSPAIPAIFASLGYKVELLAPQERSSVDVGLRYVNNDVCYPALIVIGDIVKALQSGKWDPTKTTILLTQTFGQCRASSYVPLARKALIAAGFGEVPVISLSESDALIHAGIPIDQKRLVKRLALGLMFADPLSKMALATAPRELHPGSAMVLQKKYLDELGILVSREDFGLLLAMLKAAIRDFNMIPVHDDPIPVIGLLGEIFVKHNEFSNNNIVDWFRTKGVEVVVPPLLSFFEQRFVNEEFDQQAFMKSSLRDRVVLGLLGRYISVYLHRVERAMKGFRYYRRTYDLKELAADAGKVTSLANQAGEGWLLPAEIIAMVRQGIDHIVCLQPFGCLANHIIGKGVEKRLKKLYPQLNLLYIDMDPGTTEVNILNRLHLMVMSVQAEMKWPRLKAEGE